MNKQELYFVSSRNETRNHATVPPVATGIDWLVVRARLSQDCDIEITPPPSDSDLRPGQKREPSLFIEGRRRFGDTSITIVIAASALCEYADACESPTRACVDGIKEAIGAIERRPVPPTCDIKVVSIMDVVESERKATIAERYYQQIEKDIDWYAVSDYLQTLAPTVRISSVTPIRGTCDMTMLAICLLWKKLDVVLAGIKLSETFESRIVNAPEAKLRAVAHTSALIAHNIADALPIGVE